MLFSEVLVRLPVKCLKRFKSVCRSWCAAIADADFVRRHRDRSRGILPSMLITPRESSDDDNDEFSEEISFHRLKLQLGQAPAGRGNIREELMLKKVFPPDEEDGITNKIFLTHCDGSVAIATTTNQVFVCNPATQEFVALPPGTPGFDTVEPTTAALGFDRQRNRYVVARYFYRLNDDSDDTFSTSSEDYNNKIRHEVFWLGADSTWCWKLTQDPPLKIDLTQPAFMGGAFYWKSVDESLLRFSLGDEAFEVIPPPPVGSSHYTLESLMELDGNLCYTHTSSMTKFDVWQLTDDRSSQPNWTLRCQVDTSFDKSFGSESFLPVWAGRGGMLVSVDYNKLYWYCDKSGGLEEVVDLEEEVDLGRRRDEFYQQHIIPYIESLVSIRQ